MSKLQPPSTLLVGAAGSGKTTSIATLLLCGVKVFVIVTEPDGIASLLDACERLGASLENLHWAECRPQSAGWSDLRDMVTKVNTMDQKGLADLRDLGKSAFRPAAMRFLDNLANFTSDKDGRQYGDVTKWDDNTCLVIDSLTGWSILGFSCTVGYKPTANPGEWGIAQNFIFNMLQKINNDRQCFFTLTAHQEKEMDENVGIKKLMVSTIGAKLAPKIPTFFSEVVQCQRLEGGFYWTTTSNQIDLKNRALPIGVKLEPDFAPIVEAYRKRKQRVSASVFTTVDATGTKEHSPDGPSMSTVVNLSQPSVRRANEAERVMPNTLTGKPQP